METISWIFLVLFTLIFVSMFIWYSSKCTNHIDNIINGRPYRQLSLLLGIVVFVLLYIIFIGNVLYKDSEAGLLLKIYSLFSQTSGVDTAPDPFHFKLFSLFVSFLGSIIFSGLLISTFNNAIQRRITSIKNGEIRYNSLTDHDIIIGTNEFLYPVVQYLIYNNKNRINPDKRIVIISNHSPQEIWDKLDGFDNKYKSRFIIYHGNILERKNLEELCISKSDRIVILGDNTIDKCDSENILIMDSIVNIIYPDNKLLFACKPKDCFISFFDDSYLLKYCHDLKAPLIKLYPFNFYEIWATKIWGYGHLSKIFEPDKVYTYFSLPQNKLTPVSSNFVNIILLGFNVMGMELAKTAVKICHYANYKETTGENKTRITIISDEQKNIDTFRTRYSGVEIIPDIQCDFIGLSPFTKEAHEEILRLIELPGAITTIAVCSDDPDRNNMLATHLPLAVYEKEIPIVVEYDTFSSYIEKMHKDKKRYANIRFFGFKNSVVDINYNLETAQSLMRASDMLYSRKEQQYLSVPEDLEIKDNEAQRVWHAYKIDNHRQTMLAYSDALFSILDSMDLKLVKVNKLPLENYKLEWLGEQFDYITHRQMIGWNMLAGYVPTDNISDDCNWKLNKVDILFPLSGFLKHTNRYKEVSKNNHFKQIALLRWMYQNGYYFTKSYRNLNSKGLYVYPCDKLIALPEDTLRLLYSPMARKGMWIDEATAIALEMEQPVSKDIQKAVDELLDFTPLKENPNKVKEVKDYPLLTVLPNQTCNLSCSYCYSAKGRSKDKLSLEQLENTIDYFIEKKENNTKPLSISYMGGGEPLLSWDLITDSVPYAKEKASTNNQQIDFTIITNGTLMKDDWIKFIKKHNIRISISFEIIKEIQNSQRGMYDKVIETINKLISNDIIPQINSTITPANVKRMVEMYETLDRVYPQITNMMFEPVTSAGLFKKKEKLEEFLKTYTENFLIIDTEARKKGKSLTSFPYLRTVYPTERACPGEFCVTPTGEITGCYCISSLRDPGYNQSIYGKVAENRDTEEKITIKNGTFKELVHNDNVYTRKKCEDCVVKWNCGGGCFYLRNCYSEEYQDVFCDFTRDFVQKIVLSRYKRLYEKQCEVAPENDKEKIKTNAVVLNQG